MRYCIALFVACKAQSSGTDKLVLVRGEDFSLEFSGVPTEETMLSSSIDKSFQNILDNFVTTHWWNNKEFTVDSFSSGGGGGGEDGSEVQISCNMGRGISALITMNAGKKPADKESLCRSAQDFIDLVHFNDISVSQDFEEDNTILVISVGKSNDFSIFAEVGDQDLLEDALSKKQFVKSLAVTHFGPLMPGKYKQKGLASKVTDHNVLTEDVEVEWTGEEKDMICEITCGKFGRFRVNAKFLVSGSDASLTLEIPSFPKIIAEPLYCRPLHAFLQELKTPVPAVADFPQLFAVPYISGSTFGGEGKLPVAIAVGDHDQ